MMKKNKFLFSKILILALSLSFILTGQAQAKNRRVAIFPFSDHSFKSIASVEKFNKSADTLRELEKALESKGIDLVQKEFVERVLFAEDIIRPFKFKKNPAFYEWNMINSAFSKTTNDVVTEYIINRYGDTSVLSRGKVISLAKDLGADFLIRGVILDKTPKKFMRQNKILDLPAGGISRRIIPLFLRENFYYSTTSSYENGLVSFNLERPVSFWPFYKPNWTIVQIFIFAQDGRTGDIVWSGDCKIKYLAKNYYLSSGFSGKLREKIKPLLKDFFLKVFW